MKTELIILSIVLALSFFVAIFFARPKSKIHSCNVFDTKNNKIIISVVLVITILLCTIPMNLSPIWNGEIPGHRNQYEQITEAFLKGQLHFDYEVDESLLQLENPYSPEERTNNNAIFQWDHSYYNGKYYMYFGVVPVILVFLPFRVITGVSLNTYHATQLFTALFILGLFLVFYQLAKKFFTNISLGLYLYLSVAFSFMSVWYAVSAPALYCTAITSGLAMIIWSLYFWIKAVWECDNRKQSILFATLGSLFGALSFGCRPPLGLSNIVVLGLMFYYWKNKNFKRKWIDTILFISPYVIVGVLLALYNYVRFDSFLEFGQSYQLTITDIRNTPSLSNVQTFQEKIDILITYLSNMRKYLISSGELTDLLSHGTFIAFPILFYIIIGLENTNSRQLIKKKQIGLLIGTLSIASILILLLDVMGSPDVLSRYRMDTYWILGILAFIFICLVYEIKPVKQKYSSFICYFSIFTVIISIVLFMLPHDLNFTQYLSYYG